jgi:hypothetical protein
MVNAFEGVLLKPGSTIEYRALWPDATYPETPVLLEYAGTEGTGTGHNRRNQIHVLWRFDLQRRAWVEVIRTRTEAAEWIGQLAPIALREIGGPPPPDPVIAVNFVRAFLAQLDRDLAVLAAADRAAALNQLFEQVAARLVSQE